MDKNDRHDKYDKKDRHDADDRGRYRKDAEDNDLIYGRNAVAEAIKADRPIDSVLVNKNAGGSIKHICALAAQKGIPVKQVDERKLDSLCFGQSHQGCAAYTACAEYFTVEDILKDAENKGEPPFIIICDEIEDPHNLGAIIRTAESAGAHGIIVPKRRSASLNHTVYKTSAGAAALIKTARVPNLAAAVKKLKENGVWIYGADMSGSSIYETDMTGAAALVVGSEGFGMGRLIKESCDCLISLPMLGRINSLNASVAAGICMYEIVRQRRAL